MNEKKFQNISEEWKGELEEPFQDDLAEIVEYSDYNQALLWNKSGQTVDLELAHNRSNLNPVLIELHRNNSDDQTEKPFRLMFANDCIVGQNPFTGEWSEFFAGVESVSHEDNESSLKATVGDDLLLSYVTPYGEAVVKMPPVKSIIAQPKHLTPPGEESIIRSDRKSPFAKQREIFYDVYKDFIKKHTR